MSSWLETAVRAARAGGMVIAAAREERDFVVRKKSPADFVTEVDLASERAIVDVIEADFPDHAILGEEGVAGPAADKRGSDLRWVIDPLDGTTNFIRDLPCFAVSISLEQQGSPVVGVVLDVVQEHLYCAERGHGATCNGSPLRTSERAEFSAGLWLTGIPFRNVEVLPQFLEGLERMAAGSHGIRRMGSAALDLCFVASGRAEGFWEFGLARWDVSAGALIVEEAGGRVTDFAAGASHLDTGDIVASNGVLHEAMLQRLA